MSLVKIFQKAKFMEPFIILLLLLLLNGIFAMYEIALVSARRTSLEEKAKAGRMGAKTALALLEEPEKIFSAIQVGITLVGIVSGAYAGLTLSAGATELLIRAGVADECARALAVPAVVVLVTFLTLVIGELVPKNIALSNAQVVAIYLSPPMRLFCLFVYPVVWFLSSATKFILMLLGVQNRRETPLTEEELRMILKKGSEHGVIEKEESDMINEVIRFGDKRAGALMTPRVDIVWLDLHQSPQELLQEALGAPHPRLLVCEEEIDQVKGVVNVKELLAYYIRHQTLNLQEIMFEPLYIPEQAQALKVLEMFRSTKKHFGIVINEYGSMEGIITLHDLTENIMGDLPALGDPDDPEAYLREDGSYLMDGAMKMEDAADILNVDSLLEDEEERPDVNTLGGLAMYRLNRVPKTGDKFISAGYLFEIVDMDGNRVDKLLVKTAESQQE